MAAYLTPSEAQALLAEHDIDASPTIGSLENASRQLDNMGPFIGERLNYLQPRAFPRTINVAGDTPLEVPKPVLMWVALQSYRVVRNEEPSLTSISIPQIGSKSYATPRRSMAASLQTGMLRPYIQRTGQLASTRRRFYYGGPLNNVPYV